MASVSGFRWAGCEVMWINSHMCSLLLKHTHKKVWCDMRSKETFYNENTPGLSLVWLHLGFISDSFLRQGGERAACLCSVTQLQWGSSVSVWQFKGKSDSLKAFQSPKHEWLNNRGTDRQICTNKFPLPINCFLYFNFRNISLTPLSSIIVPQHANTFHSLKTSKCFNLIPSAVSECV